MTIDGDASAGHMAWSAHFEKLGFIVRRALPLIFYIDAYRQ